MRSTKNQNKIKIKFPEAYILDFISYFMWFLVSVYQSFKLLYQLNISSGHIILDMFRIFVFHFFYWE